MAMRFQSPLVYIPGTSIVQYSVSPTVANDVGVPVCEEVLIAEVTVNDGVTMSWVDTSSLKVEISN